MVEGEWTLAVDMGGTFTDCLARDSRGREQRLKVLSSSALRARLIEVPVSSGPWHARIDASWRGADDLVRGFRLRLRSGRLF